METLATLVRRWRLENGLSQPQLAQRLGVTQQALQQLEAGEVKAPRYLPALAKLMELDALALSGGRREPALSPVPTGDATGVGAAPLGRRDLPVYSSAQAGPDGMTVAYEPIEWIERPGPLQGVPGAFAMYVVNDSMVPRYRQGDLLLVHPQRPVRRGQDVLAIKRAADADHAALIKELVSLDTDRVVLRQLNPPADIELPRRELAGLNLVLGVFFGG